MLQSGRCGLKNPHSGPLISRIWTIQGKPMAKPFLSLLLRSSTKAIITPTRQASILLQVLQNRGSYMFIKRVKTCQLEIANDKIQQKKYRECSNM